jgi:hypothetical protein
LTGATEYGLIRLPTNNKEEAKVKPAHRTALLQMLREVLTKDVLLEVASILRNAKEENHEVWASTHIRSEFNSLIVGLTRCAGSKSQQVDVRRYI